MGKQDKPWVRLYLVGRTSNYSFTFTAVREPLARRRRESEMPRGVAVASVARLPSSTDDPSGSTADRHEPVEDWGSTRGHVHT